MPVEKLVLCTLTVALAPVFTANAYIGPLLGAGTSAILSGFFGAIIMTIMTYIRNGQARSGIASSIRPQPSGCPD